MMKMTYTYTVRLLDFMNRPVDDWDIYVPTVDIGQKQGTVLHSKIDIHPSFTCYPIYIGEKNVSTLLNIGRIPYV